MAGASVRASDRCSALAAGCTTLGKKATPTCTRCRRQLAAVDVLQRALLLIGCSCAIEHESLWLGQLQSLGDANPIRLRETSFLISGKVLTPQTHALRHATKTCPLNPPYPADTLSLGCEQLHRMYFVDENESSRRGSGRRRPLPHGMHAHACSGRRPGRSCMQRRFRKWEVRVLPAWHAGWEAVYAVIRYSIQIERYDRCE